MVRVWIAHRLPIKILRRQTVLWNNNLNPLATSSKPAKINTEILTGHFTGRKITNVIFKDSLDKKERRSY